MKYHPTYKMSPNLHQFVLSRFELGRLEELRRLGSRLIVTDPVVNVIPDGQCICSSCSSMQTKSRKRKSKLKTSSSNIMCKHCNHFAKPKAVDRLQIQEFGQYPGQIPSTQPETLIDAVSLIYVCDQCYQPIEIQSDANDNNIDSLYTKDECYKRSRGDSESQHMSGPCPRDEENGDSDVESSTSIDYEEMFSLF
jgi:hypothetical protein